MTRPFRIRLSSRSLVLAIFLVWLSFGVLAVRVLRERPLPSPVGPIQTGIVVEPSAPGETPAVSADTVPLVRPDTDIVGSKAWQLKSRPRGQTVLEGYASKPSYLPGEPLRIALSTSASAVEATIWRVSGRERDGAPFRLMASIPAVAGSMQPPPTVDPVTKMPSASWAYGLSFPIPASWPSGVYVARLASNQHVQSYVPFVVRSTSAHAILVVSGALNWQAYNTWGGASLYVTQVGQPLPGVNRALAASFNRPYVQGGGAGQLFNFELPLLRWIDEQRLDVAYTTDYDLSIAPQDQLTPRVVVVNAHDEYWGPALYDWLERHVAIGDVSLAMLAADSGYWPVAFRDLSTDGPRSFICLKRGPVPRALVPGAGSPNATPPPSPTPSPGAPSPSTPPADIEEPTDILFHALGPDGPYLGTFPGEPIFGVRYRGVTTALGRYTLAAGGEDPRLMTGTGLAAGASLGFIAGGEVDGVWAEPLWWGPLGGKYDHVFAEAIDIPGRPPYRQTAQAVWRELPSGSRVFSAGTFYWGWALDPVWGAAHGVPAGFGQLTLNVVRFLLGPS